MDTFTPVTTIDGVGLLGLPEWKLTAIGYHADRLDKWIKAFEKWMAYCNTFEYVPADAENPIGGMRATAATPKRAPRNPSKTSKHHAYDDASQIARMLADAGLIVARASTVDELRLTVATARLYLAKIALAAAEKAAA